MPAEPEVQDVFEIEHLTPNVPTRDGEERFQTGLNLEDARRREAMKAEVIAELRRDLKKLEGTSAEGLHLKPASSKAARARQRMMRAKQEELSKLTHKRIDPGTRVGRWEGPNTPCTVINLNPVPLSLQGELQKWSVPAAGKGLGINLKFRGRVFTGSYTTFNKSHLWMVHTGTMNESAGSLGIPLMEVKHIPPLGLAHQLFSHYVEGASDAQYMGGVLIFEGDIHTLDPLRLEYADGSIWIPRLEITLEGLGDMIYTVEERKLVEVMGESLTMQRRYAEGRIAEGHSFATSESDIRRNQLSSDHILWHNFALERGYMTEAYSWASKKLTDSPTTQAVHCPDCRNRQKDPEQYFCTNCNSPFDPLKAFLAGKTVSPDKLAIYEGEEWDAIVAESSRRKKKIAMLTETPSGVAETSDKKQDDKEKKGGR